MRQMILEILYMELGRKRKEAWWIFPTHIRENYSNNQEIIFFKVGRVSIRQISFHLPFIFSRFMFILPLPTCSLVCHELCMIYMSYSIYRHPANGAFCRRKKKKKKQKKKKLWDRFSRAIVTSPLLLKTETQHLFAFTARSKLPENAFFSCYILWGGRFTCG